MKKKITTMAGVALAAAVLAGTGTALASIPGSDGVIHGCYLVKDGTLRVIDTDAGQSCVKGEKGLSWNQAGPQGPAGPAGPQGDPGLSGVHVVDTGTLTFTGPITITCPNSETALSIVFREVPITEPNLNFYIAEPLFPYGTGRPGGYEFNVQPSPGRSLAPYAAAMTCANSN